MVIGISFSTECEMRRAGVSGKHCNYFSDLCVSVSTVGWPICNELEIRLQALYQVDFAQILTVL